MQEKDFQKNYEMLNEAQKQVVEEIYGPIMVVAGPGTGKTQIIGLRTANIILKAGVNPENILITTFTEAGVIAIKKRLAKFIGTEAYKVKVSTIHSFAQDVIVSFPEKFAKQKASETIDDIECLQALTKILDIHVKEGNIEYLFNAFDRSMYLRDIKDRIGKLKGEGISPDDFEKIIANLRNEYDEKLEALKANKRIRDLEKRTAKDKETYKKHIGKLTELNLIYREYSEYLRKNSLYDFSDMINFVVEKMKEDEDLCHYYAEKYQFIMIDEYQDTNNPQNEIMDMILSVSVNPPPAPLPKREESKAFPLPLGEVRGGQLGIGGSECNIMVVGDDDQSIYRFQGANIENMLDFYSKYPETKFIVLENNYRSAQSILDFASTLIENNSERLVNRLNFLEKKLIAQSEYKDLDENQYLVFANEIAEKMFVRRDIESHQTTDASFAIIVRSNREVEEWTHFFQTQNIEVESKLKTNILNNGYVKLLIAFMKIVDDPHKYNESIIDIARSEIIDLENIDVITLNRDLYQKNYSKKGHLLNFWDLLKNIDIDYGEQYRDEEENYSFETRQESKFRDYKKLLSFRDLIVELNSDIASHGTGQLISRIIEKLGLIDHIEKQGNFSDLEDIFTLFGRIKHTAEKKPDISLGEMLERFDLHTHYRIAIPRQILKKSKSNIEILTAHASKGLEYDYVYIPGLHAGNWENKRMIDKLKLPLGVAGSGLQYAGLDEKELKNVEKQMALQEDRRLFFVASTRAKQQVIFSRAAGKDNKPYIDSPFLLEMGLSGKMQEVEIAESLMQADMKSILIGSAFIKTTDEEIEYISDFLESYKLSPTDLNTFLEDPLSFLQNVIFKYPFSGNEFTIFGNVYHKVLEESINMQFNGEEVKLGFMTERFSELLEKQLLTAEEKPRLLKKGIDGLTGYHESFKNNPRKPLKVEYNFRSRNVVFEGIPITGKVDKIEKINTSPPSNSADLTPSPSPQGEGSQMGLFTTNVALVDYKTGKAKTLGAIKGIDRYGNKKDDMSEGRYYRQLLFYKLLAENDPEFHSQYTVGELALDFVEGRDGKYDYVPVDLGENDFTEFKQLVQDSWKQINSLDFWRELLGK